MRQCSEVGDLPGEQVRLVDLPGEQVHFGLALQHWPAVRFGQLGQRSVQLPLQYFTGNKVVH